MNQPAKMTDKELKEKSDDLKRQIEKKDKLLEFWYNKRIAPSREHPTGKIPEQYYKVQEEKAELINIKTDIDNEIFKCKPKQKATAKDKKFVNSFGEATKREITSLAYERTRKRTVKQIDSMFKNR